MLHFNTRTVDSLGRQADDLVRAVADIRDPVTRAKAALRVREATDKPLVVLRREAVLQLVERLIPRAAIAEALGITPNRVTRIINPQGPATGRTRRAKKRGSAAAKGR